jgi:hypothetical protein
LHLRLCAGGTAAAGIICVYVSVFNMLIAASIALCVHNEAVYLNVGKNVKMLRLYFAV